MADKKYRLKFQMSDGSERPVEFTAPQGDPGVVDVDSASVGQIIKVKAVDASGKPTEWEAVDLLDTALAESNKAAPANVLGEVKANAEAAAHGAVIAGEGALVVPLAEAYVKLMNGEAVAEQFVHVSDKVPTMADLEAGYSLMMYSIFEDGGYLSGANANVLEVMPKVMNEEVFTDMTQKQNDAIIVGAGLIIIVPTDNYTLDEVIFPKKGIYIPLGIGAFRINGYSFSGGSDSGVGSVTVSGNTISWDGDTTGLVSWQVDSGLALYKVSDSTPTYAEMAKGFSVTVIENGVGKLVTYTEEDIANWGDQAEPPLQQGSDEPVIYVDVFACVVLEDTESIDGSVVPKGTYFLKGSDDAGGSVFNYTTKRLTTTGFSNWTSVNADESASIPDAIISYVANNPDENPYMYKTSDLTDESGRLTASELESITKSGVKHLLYMKEGDNWGYSLPVMLAYIGGIYQVLIYGGTYYSAEYVPETTVTEVTE